MGKIDGKGKRLQKKDRSILCTLNNSVRDMKNRYLPQILGKIWQEIKTRLYTALKKIR